MAAYVTPADMQALFPHRELVQATNRDDVAATEINVTVLQEACNWATATADGYLALVAELPLANPPAWLINALRTHCGNIARWYLLASEDELLTKRYEEAIAWLQAIANQPGALGGGVSANTGTGINYGLPQDECRSYPLGGLGAWL